MLYIDKIRHITIDALLKLKCVKIILEHGLYKVNS